MMVFSVVWAQIEISKMKTAVRLIMTTPHNGSDCSLTSNKRYKTLVFIEKNE